MPHLHNNFTQPYLSVSGKAIPVIDAGIRPWTATAGKVAVVAPFDELGALQIDLKGTIVIAPCCDPAVPRGSAVRQVLWFQHHGAKAVVLPMTAAHKQHQKQHQHRQPSTNARKRESTHTLDPNRNRTARAQEGLQAAIPAVFMDADDILDTMAMLRCNLHPSEALLVPPPPSQVQDEDIQVRSRKQSPPLLTGVTSSSSSLFGFDEEDVFHAHNVHTAVTSLRADCTTSNSSSSSAAAAGDYYDQDQDDGDDPNHGRGTNFLSAALARDRMRGLESQIERTTSSALPTPMVVEFLWLKHRAEENPQLDTLGPKGVGHGGVAAMPRSLYTAVMIIPLIVTGLVGPQTEEDVETGIVSRRRVLETLFCLGDVDLPRGPQRSCLSSFVACSAVMGIRCFDGIYAWVVSGAPWYLFHFSSLAAQVIFIWYIRTADIEQQQQQQQEGEGGGGAIGLQSDGSLFADAGDSIINSSANATIELSTACAASRPLRFVAAGVYSGMLFKEICETFSMAAWLYRAPASSVTEPIQVSRASPSTASVDLISGFSAWYKCWCIFIAVIPKLALAAALWLYGGAFILRAVNDSELILNTVAVTFVNEIDDLLYTVLVPPDIDRLLADLPELDWMPPAKPGQKGSTLRRWSIALNTFAGQYLYAGIILAMTYGALEVACQ